MAKPVDGEELAAKLGVPFWRSERADPEREELIGTDVNFFKLGDPKHTRVATDGELIPIGQPVEELRRDFGGDEGVVSDPFGNPFPIRIPPEIGDGEGYYVSIAFHSRPIGDEGFTDSASCARHPTRASQRGGPQGGLPHKE